MKTLIAIVVFLIVAYLYVTMAPAPAPANKPGQWDDKLTNLTNLSPNVVLDHVPAIKTVVVYTPGQQPLTPLTNASAHSQTASLTLN